MTDHRQLFPRGTRVKDCVTGTHGTVAEVSGISVIVRPDDRPTVIQFSPVAALRDLAIIST